MNISTLENMPCNQGYMFCGDKFYGELPCVDPEKVKFFDVEKDQIHIWSRYCHSVFNTEGKKLVYENSHSMSGCPYEKMYGYCAYRSDCNHRQNYYHYTYTMPKYHQGKSVCRYSLTDKNHLCWERKNAEHIHMYHHMN